MRATTFGAIRPADNFVTLRGETVTVFLLTTILDTLRGAALAFGRLAARAGALLVVFVRLALFVARPRLELALLPRLAELERLRLALLPLLELELERLRPLLERPLLELRPLRPREDPRRAII